jgi:hypothetical protein
MSKFVTIACKLPHGLLIEVGTPGLENYHRYELNGTYTGSRKGKPQSLVIDGYAFTSIPEDAWIEWSKNHRGAQYLKNRAVYCESSIEGAQAAALTDGSLVTGFERLNPDKPAPGIEPDNEHLKTLQRVSV